MKSPIRTGVHLHVIERLITQEQVDKYAQASGDFNPIHIDACYAKTSQFGHTIAHGMMIASLISEMMTMEFETDWARSGRMKIRFRAPAYPGDTVMTTGKVKTVNIMNTVQEVICSVGVQNQQGENLITGDSLVKIAT